MALTPLEERIVSKIGRHSVTISEIESGFFADIPSRSKLYRALQKLLHKSVIRQTGDKRGRRYEKVKP